VQVSRVLQQHAPTFESLRRCGPCAGGRDLAPRAVRFRQPLRQCLVRAWHRPLEPLLNQSFEATPRASVAMIIITWACTSRANANTVSWPSTAVAESLRSQIYYYRHHSCRPQCHLQPRRPSRRSRCRNARERVGCPWHIDLPRRLVQTRPGTCSEHLVWICP